MSALYGTVYGMSDTAATRRGSKNSGIKVAAQSYDGSVIVSLDYLGDDQLPTVTVGTSKSSSTCSDWSSQDFRGSIEEFNELLKLANDIKTGKVSVVRHRTPRGIKS